MLVEGLSTPLHALSGGRSVVDQHIVCTISQILVEGFSPAWHIMAQYALKNVNSCLNTNNYSYLETSGGQSSNLYLNVVHFFNTNVI
jgi:hypothetical protein